MTAEEFLPSGINSTDFDTVKKVDIVTQPLGGLSTLKEFQDEHQQVFFTPAIAYAWAYEQQLDFDPLFSDLPDRYWRHIKKLSALPVPIVDGFYGNQEHWNNTLWTIPAELWIPFCKQIAGKGYFDPKEKLVVVFSVGVCNAEDVLARLKGKQPGFITLAYIGVHTSEHSIVMSESLETTTLSLAQIRPDANLVAFADKFFNDEVTAASHLALRPRAPLKIEEPDVCTEADLTRAQKRKFSELSRFYRQVFDERAAEPEDADE